jgi:hypothetical protein
MEVFRNALDGRGTAHILLIRAEAGLGKSSLLHEFLEMTRPGNRAFVDLKAGTHSVPRLLGELVAQLGHAKFDAFFARQEQAFNFEISDNRIIKAEVGIEVNVQPGALDADQLELRRFGITRDFFADLVRSNTSRTPNVLIFDTFERASPEVQDWLTGQFLTLAREHRWLVAVFAGREIPEPGIGWDDWCIEQSLRPLDPAHIDEWVRRVNLPLSAAEIAILYDTTAGIPLDLSIQLGRLLLRRREPDAS